MLMTGTKVAKISTMCHDIESIVLTISTLTPTLSLNIYKVASQCECIVRKTHGESCTFPNAFLCF